MLLPLKYNDGREIPLELFEQSREELIAQFDAVSALPGTVQGAWVREGRRYLDELARWVVDVDEAQETYQFFVQFKEVLLERFEQIELYIVSYLIDIL